jgi:hypothetical protein
MEWRPNEKQSIALSMRSVRELFYGGARGGGKTDYLLVDFLMGVNEWGEYWNGVIFRQSYAQLEDIVKRGKQLYLPLGAEYHKAENYFSFPTGSEIKLRYLGADEDCEQYQGHAFPWIGIDELGNYPTDYAWNMMMMCNRSAHVDDGWVRMRGTGNPGGAGHSWLKERFIEGRDPCKVYQEKVGKDAAGNDLFISRCFVPATIYDNKHLLTRDPHYLANLTSQPLRMRQAMLEGRWDIKGGGEFFDEFDASVHVIPPKILKGEWKRFYAMDWGYKTPYAVLKLAVDYDGRVVVYGEIYGQGEVDGVPKENVGSRETSETVAFRVAGDMAREGVSECIADYNMWEEKGTGSSPIDAFLNAGIDMIKADKKHGMGWQTVHNLLKDRDEFGRPYIQIFSCCKHLIRELEHLQTDRTNCEELADRQADHCADALRYGLYSELYEGRGAGNASPVLAAAAEKASFAYDPLKSGYWGRGTAAFS